jgi:acyl carrier protein
MSTTESDARWKQAMDAMAGHPAETQAAVERFLRARDPEALREVVTRVVQFHLPAKPEGPVEVAQQPGTSRLVEDLGLDSLAMVEMSFLLDEVLGVKFTDDEMKTLRTLDDLHAAVRTHAIGA